VACGAGAIEGTLGGAGLVVTRRDASYMAGVVDRVLRDPELSTRLVRAGRNRVGAFDLAAGARRAVEAIATVAGPAPVGLAR
jgi:glycosyltransferase involved in cell wall biosynthesis